MVVTQSEQEQEKEMECAMEEFDQWDHDQDRHFSSRHGPQTFCAAKASYYQEMSDHMMLSSCMLVNKVLY